MTGRPAAERREELVALYHELNDCHRCPLSATRTHVVFGMGNADADLMFVGEAPGFHEDQQGKPFVGAAGKLLDQLLGEIGMSREETFVANVLKCRPPGNRDPLPDEIEECTPYLLRQIELIEPRVICSLGNFATKLLSGRAEGITRCHGRPQLREVAGLSVTLFPICHPAAGLRSAAMLEMLRADFRKLPGLLEQARPEQPAPPSPLEARVRSGGNVSAETPSAEALASQLGLFG